jgi:phage-related protein
MSNFQAVYYRDASGREPVVDFLGALDPKTRAALRNHIGRLNLLSHEQPHLPFPHSSQIAGELRELRCHRGREHYRVLYARSESLIVVLHAFPKRSAQIPRSEIDTAWQRWTDFKQRMNARQRRPPRAAGTDAP